MSNKNEGKCYNCGEIFGKTAMAKHLSSCGSKAEKSEPGHSSGGDNNYRISVQGKYTLEYWMYLDVDVRATLDDLDMFLRHKWLECCGHMSAFNINGVSYVSRTDKAMGDKSMGIKLANVLHDAGMKFIYEYDFGSTTTLQLKVVSNRTGTRWAGTIELLARNLPITHKCSYCDKKAEQICCECIYDNEGYLCEACAETHECGEEMQLPVCNSPRMGVCAYCGGDED